MCNTLHAYATMPAAQLLKSLQDGCSTGGRTLDVSAITEKQWCSVWGRQGGDLLGALFQRLDQHLLEGADLLQVS